MFSVLRIGIVAAVLTGVAVPPALAESRGWELAQRIWDLGTGEEIERDVLVERLRGADVVLLGEVHDNGAAHRAQGALVRLLTPEALAVEMIDTVDEGALNAWLGDGGAPSGIGEQVGWADSGWPAWELYAPVFKDWVPGRIYGAALPREDVRRSMTDGAAAIPLAPAMTEALSQPLSEPVQAEMEQEMVDAHCGHLPKEMAPGMIEAQRLRDASLASAVLRAREAGAATVGVIAGNGHVRMDRGIALYLPGDVSAAAVGILEADIGIAARDIAASGLPYDFVWFVPPADREDPCAMFKKRKKS